MGRRAYVAYTYSNAPSNLTKRQREPFNFENWKMKNEKRVKQKENKTKNRPTFDGAKICVVNMHNIGRQLHSTVKTYSPPKPVRRASNQLTTQLVSQSFQVKKLLRRLKNNSLVTI